VATIDAGAVELGQGQAHARAPHTLKGSLAQTAGDRDRAHAETDAHVRDGSQVHYQLGQVLADKAIDLFVIAAPGSPHGPHTPSRPEAGKHVLSTTPIPPTIEACAPITRVTKRIGLNHQPGNQVRSPLCLQGAIPLANQGVSGDIVHSEGKYPRDMGDVLAQ
jgi:predicted dehydrogenase